MSGKNCLRCLIKFICENRNNFNIKTTIKKTLENLTRVNSSTHQHETSVEINDNNLTTVNCEHWLWNERKIQMF